MAKYTTIILLALLAAALPAAAQLTFSGSAYKVIEEKPEASTGLDMIYVVYDTQGVSASYKAQSSSVKWLRYSNLGGGYAEDVATTQNNGTYTINLGADDMGYIIEDGTKRLYYWVVNYARHHAEINSLTIADDQDCDRTRLDLDGNLQRITYFTINGAGKDLSRDLQLSYRTLRYDEEGETYNEIETTVRYPGADRTISAIAPLCDTRFTLTADRFLAAWGMPLQVETGNFKATAVEAHTKAVQTQRENDNEQHIDVQALGGSAPVEITFSAAVTDAAIFREWQMSHDPEFETILDRFTQLDFTYTFRDNGNTYVRFVADNAAGTCQYTGETYEVFVGESALVCPNAFSPNGDGVNDEWKVSYKSIVKFECHIFNRWGQEIFSFTDPSIGWDGRYKGKYVPTGAYFYVIRATGSDGRKYKLDGDINILHSKANPLGPSTEE